MIVDDAHNVGGIDEPNPIAELDQRGGPTWEYEGNWRLPAANRGKWAGTKGDSRWTPYDPGAYGLDHEGSVPFRQGVPDFTEHAIETPAGNPGIIEVEGLGHNRKYDVDLTIKSLAEREYLDEAAVKNWLKENRIDLHHFSGNEMQLVPERLHRALGHQGSWKEMVR
jgi:hypothetical protein